jgi:hypothetical protein
MLESRRSVLFMVLLVAAASGASLAGTTVCPPTSGPIVINEIAYDPPGNPDVEYIELYNNSVAVVDLNGWYLLDDNDTHDKCFLVGSLNPGEYLVVPNVTSLFTAKFPGVTNINANQFDDDLLDPEVGFVLGDGGDQARLFNASHVGIDCVTYDDTPPWPTEPDGDGPSLELYHPNLDNTLASSWAASTNAPPEGTPGAQNSVFTADQPPIVDTLVRSIPLPKSADTVTVTVHVTDAIGVASVDLLVDTGSGFVAQPMFDDGAHGDGPPGNSTYGAFVSPHATGTLVRYYVLATDTSMQTTTLPVTAPAEYLAYTVDHVLPELVINEIVAVNETGIIDPDEPQPGADPHEDWVEIKNAGPRPVDLTGMFLTNAFEQSMEWQLPAVSLDPGEYLLIWADDDADQGPLHTNFRLSSAGAEIVLWESVDKGNVMIHGFKFGVQSADVAFGFLPDDGDAPEYIADPSPGASNDASSVFSSICINEFQTTSAAGGVDDWVELCNRGSSVINMGGWHLTDEADQPEKFTFPPNIFVAPGNCLVLTEVTLGFAWSSTGVEVVMLTDAAGRGMDYFDYGPQSNDISQGRYPDFTNNWHFFDPPSKGLTNTCSGVAGLDPVTNFRFDSKTMFTWDAPAGAEAYDVVAVGLGTLRGGGSFAGAVLECLKNNGERLEAWAGTTPASGEGFAYLGRAVDFSCSFGTYDTLAPTQEGPRDPGVAAAPQACP